MDLFPGESLKCQEQFKVIKYITFYARWYERYILWKIMKMLHYFYGRSWACTVHKSYGSNTADFGWIFSKLLLKSFLLFPICFWNSSSFFSSIECENVKNWDIHRFFFFLFVAKIIIIIIPHYFINLWVSSQQTKFLNQVL